MTVLVAGNRTIEQLVEDDSHDHNRQADPPVATYPVAESLGHLWTIRRPGDPSQQFQRCAPGCIAAHWARRALMAWSNLRGQRKLALCEDDIGPR